MRNWPESVVVPTPSTFTPTLDSVFWNVGMAPKMPMEPVMVAGMRPDLIGRSRDVVAARGRQIAHGNHHGLAAALQRARTSR